MVVTDKYVFFWDGIYSNWYPSKFEMDGHTFANSEQAFIYGKALVMNDNESIEEILKETNPRNVKALGRKIKNFDEDLWFNYRVSAMRNACFGKFNQNYVLRKQLLETGDRILVEASPYDKIWGIGMLETDPDVEDETKWCGLNLLGEVLMDVRQILKSA